MRLLWVALLFVLLVATVAAQDQPIYVLALPVVRQVASTGTPAPISTIAPPPSRTATETSTPTIANTPIPSITPTSSATVTPTVTATDDPTDNDPSLDIYNDDDDPIAGQSFVLSGTVTDSNGDAIINVTVTVTYKPDGGSESPWCTTTTTSPDGDWKCTVPISSDLKDKHVTWTGTITVNGRTVTEEYDETVGGS